MLSNAKPLHSGAIWLCLWLACLSCLSACNLWKDSLDSACEDLIKERLTSPSGYRLVESSRHQEIVKDEGEFIAWQQLNGGKSSATDETLFNNLRKYNDGPIRTTVTISFDAPNAYGTLVRKMSVCEYVSINKDISQANKFSTRLDGFTSYEYLVEQTKGLLQ